MIDLGRIALVANPVSQNGRGAEETARAEKLLRNRFGQELTCVLLTQHKGHARDLATLAVENFGADTLFVLGGDGTVHEAVDAIMHLPEEKRPRLVVLPVGSGNDYAKSLGLPFDAGKVLAMLDSLVEERVDVGVCNGEYFAETLSFGLDAAIAADTMQRRVRTGHTGTRLYLESGMDQLLHHLEFYRYKVRALDYSPLGKQSSTWRACTGIEDELTAGDKVAAPRVQAGEQGWSETEGSSAVFAVQVGKTYGGGFKVCPEADLTDGLFDVCWAHEPLSVAKAAGVFLLAKEGLHCGFKQIEQFRASALEIEFESEPKTQMDGEILGGTRFSVSMEPAALRVLRKR